MIGIILLSTLILEVFVLTYMEYISWRTLYTPLTCLMLPYFVVLLATILFAGHFNLVEFYYPSIFIWNIGLPLFAIPSFVLSLVKTKSPEFFSKDIKEDKYPNVLGILSILLFIAFLLRFIQTLHSSTALFGTDDFAEDFCGHGVWAHLRTAVMPLIIIAIYYAGRRTWWLWLIILSLLSIQFLYMVKGAVIISVIAGLFIRISTDKTHLDLGLIVKILGGAFFVFIIVYIVLPLLGKGSDYADTTLLQYVAKHFLHYFTSGTLGYSYDLQHNCPDRNGFEYLVSPFVNIYNWLTGNKELLSPVNPYYHHTGINFTNVRTFFGTMYIYCNVFQFVIYTWIVSTFIYLIRLLALHNRNVFTHAILSYYCALLAMGWFEFYFFHLAVIEVPLITILLMVLSYKKFQINKT